MEKGDAGPGRKERDCTPRCVQGVCLLKGINLRICTGCPVKLASLKRYYLARFRDTILIVFCNQPDPQTSQPTRSSLHSSSASFFQPLVFPPRRHPFSLSFCLFLSSLFSLSFSRPLSSSSCFWDLENSGELAPLHDFIAFLSHFKCPFQLSFFFFFCKQLRKHFSRFLIYHFLQHDRPRSLDAGFSIGSSISIIYFGDHRSSRNDRIVLVYSRWNPRTAGGIQKREGQSVAEKARTERRERRWLTSRVFSFFLFTLSCSPAQPVNRFSRARAHFSSARTRHPHTRCHALSHGKT